MGTKNRNDGFTLVEMIISMTVASVVTAQVFVVLSTQQSVYAGNERVVEAQQDARLVTEMIQSDVPFVVIEGIVIACVSSIQTSPLPNDNFTSLSNGSTRPAMSMVSVTTSLRRRT